MAPIICASSGSKMVCRFGFFDVRDLIDRETRAAAASAKHGARQLPHVNGYRHGRGSSCGRRFTFAITRSPVDKDLHRALQTERRSMDATKLLRSRGEISSFAHATLRCKTRISRSRHRNIHQVVYRTEQSVAMRTKAIFGVRDFFTSICARTGRPRWLARPNRGRSSTC